MISAAYLSLVSDGGLRRRAAHMVARLAACTLCARRCGADRTQGIHRATCRIGRWAKVAPAGAWTDAEACLGGTAAIAFSGCNLRCLACNTWESSWDGRGDEVSAEQLAAIMLELQAQGFQRLALVSPSHVPAQILEALALAAEGGLTLPLVWDSGGYDSPETLALLNGVVDIYRPDLKHGHGAVARVCTGVVDYPEVNAQVIAAMHAQVGDLVMGEDGMARRGLLARHLVLPNDLAGTAAALACLPAGSAVNVMDSYRPVFRAAKAPKLNRPATAEEVAAAREVALRLGLNLFRG